jgi:hypothetical protein
VTVADLHCRGCGSGTKTSGALLWFRGNGWFIRSTALNQRVSWLSNFVKIPVSCFFKLGSSTVLSHCFLEDCLSVNFDLSKFLNFFSHGTVADVFGLPAAPDPYHTAYCCGSGTPRTLNCPRQNPDRYVLAIVCHCVLLLLTVFTAFTIFTVIHCYSLFFTVTHCFHSFHYYHCYSLFYFHTFALLLLSRRW